MAQERIISEKSEKALEYDRYEPSTEKPGEAKATAVRSLPAQAVSLDQFSCLPIQRLYHGHPTNISYRQPCRSVPSPQL